mgnify:FL=1
MLNTSELYKNLFEAGAIQEYKVEIGGVEHASEIIYDKVDLQQRLFDKETFTIGSFAVSKLEVKLNLPSNEIPRNATIKFSYRYTDGTDHSEWIQKFSGRVTDRSKYTDTVTSIVAHDNGANYDVFLDVFQTEVPAYPANARLIANLCASHLGLTVENIEDVYDGNIVEYPNELSVVEVLQNIAKSSGGNWTVTENETLRLVVLMPDENFIIDNVEKTFVENIPRNKVNSDFELEQILTLECYFGIKLGDLM